mmetsp:Transcript_1868/g.5517  ORF Transcript_1868/g.5517 Transcript_1868/m.5517 type:complete len:364 (+) Transcript_1868:716-1807(+)
MATAPLQTEDPSLAPGDAGAPRSRFEREATRRMITGAYGISGMVVLPDGRVVTAACDGVVKVWHARRGCVRTLKAADSILSVALLPGGRVVTGAGDPTSEEEGGCLQICDLNDGRRLRTLRGHGPYVVWCILALADGRILSGATDNKLMIWDPNDGRCLMTLQTHAPDFKCVVLCAAALPDGRVVSGHSGDHGNIKCWDVTDGRCLRTFTLSGTPYCIAVLSVNRVICGLADSTLQVWDLTSGHCLRTLAGHSHDIQGVALLPNGRVVSVDSPRPLSANKNATLKIWDLHGGRCLQTLTGAGTTAGLRCVVALPDGRISSGSADGALEVWFDWSQAMEKKMAAAVALQRTRNKYVVASITKFL